MAAQKFSTDGAGRGLKLGFAGQAALGKGLRAWCATDIFVPVELLYKVYVALLDLRHLWRPTTALK